MIVENKYENLALRCNFCNRYLGLSNFIKKVNTRKELRWCAKACGWKSFSKLDKDTCPSCQKVVDNSFQLVKGGM